MAAPMRIYFGINVKLLKATCVANTVCMKASRTLLSEAYRCDEAWNKRLSASVLQSLPDTSDYAVSLRDNFEKTGSLSAIDMDLLANRLHDIPETQLEFMEDLFQSFGKTQSCLKMTEATPCALVRAYIHHNHADRLVAILRDKLTYHVFLDNLSANLLIDYFVKQNKIYEAAQVCYEFMTQEEFTHPTSRLLSVYVCSRHIDSVDLKPPEPTVEENQEEDWIPLDYINNPHFDFHFDLNEDKLLLGKTLLMLSHELDGTTAFNCRVVGNAFFEHFDSAVDLLEQLARGDVQEGIKIHQNILARVRESLDLVTTRDPDVPPKEAGFLRNEDDRHVYHPTATERDGFIERLQNVSEELEQKHLVNQSNFHEAIKDGLTTAISEREPIDISDMTKQFDEWTLKRDEMIAKQLQKHYDKQKTASIVTRLKEIKEKEELLSYFENRYKIAIAADSAPRVKPRIDPEAIRIGKLKRRKVRIAAVPANI